MVPAPKDRTETYYAKKNESLDLGREVDAYAMWSFLLSLSPIFTLFIPIVNLINLFTPFAAIILGGIGLKKIKEQSDKRKGRGFAIAGIAIGAIELIAGILLIVGAMYMFQGDATAIVNTTLRN